MVGYLTLGLAVLVTDISISTKKGENIIRQVNQILSSRKCLPDWVHFHLMDLGQQLSKMSIEHIFAALSDDAGKVYLCDRGNDTFSNLLYVSHE